MPDITMCDGGDCPIKATCYRHTAEANEYRQAYFVAPPHEAGDCAYYVRAVDDEQQAAEH